MAFKIELYRQHVSLRVFKLLNLNISIYAVWRSTLL